MNARDKTAASNLRRHIRMWFRCETKVSKAKIGKMEIILRVVKDIA